MASSTPVPIVSPQPRRVVPLNGLQDRKNRFLRGGEGQTGGENEEGTQLSTEIGGILQSRANYRPIAAVGNKASPTLSRRAYPQEKQPPRPTANPILADPIFQDFEKSGVLYPWESPIASPQL